MSMVMEAAEDAWQRGYSDVPETLVCADHINEIAIKRFINRSGTRDVCDYCGRRKVVAELETVVEYIMDAVAHFYTDPANFMSYDSAEGGYLGNVYSASEILQEQFEIDVDNNQLFNDIFDSLDDNKPWSNEFEYYDHEGEIRLEHWNFFKEVIKNKSRYFFSTTLNFKTDYYELNAYDILKHIDSIVKKFKLIHNIPAGSSFYRCRQHSKREKITEAKQLCSPPTEYAIYPNRMSPAGISMFYGARQLETALQETLNPSDKKNKWYTYGLFTTRNDLKILDLSKCPPIPSMLEQRLWDKYYLISFLNAFIRDLTHSVNKDGKIHIEYVPTQVVTEYFRYNFATQRFRGLDGIIYPSSKHPGGVACVLFMDHIESLEQLEFNTATLTTKKINP
jgi:hypothetical protein